MALTVPWFTLSVAGLLPRRPVFASGSVHVGMCDGTATSFAPSSSVFPCWYPSTVALRLYIIWWMNNDGRSTEIQYSPHRQEQLVAFRPAIGLQPERYTSPQFINIIYVLRLDPLTCSNFSVIFVLVSQYRFFFPVCKSSLVMIIPVVPFYPNVGSSSVYRCLFCRKLIIYAALVLFLNVMLVSEWVHPCFSA
jgi:hypothetical protein